MQTDTCDVLIVGAGAAGSVAALTALQAGLDVIVVEKEPTPGRHTQTKIDLTDGLDLGPILDELDLPVIDRSHRSRWFSPRHVLDYTSGIPSLYVKRGCDPDSFETRMAARLQDAGIRMLTGATPIRFKRGDNGRVQTVFVRRGTETRAIAPSCVIGADGADSTVRALSGLSPGDQVFGAFHAYGVYGTDFAIPPGEPYIFFHRDMAPGGYVFAGRSRNNECVLGVGFDPCMEKRTGKDCFAAATSHPHIGGILDGATIINHFSGLGVYGSLTRRATANVLLAGDAGRLLDPLICFGLRQAILSGYAAAVVCRESLAGASARDPSQVYEDQIADLVTINNLGLFLRKVYRTLGNRDMDTIVKILSDAQQDGLNLDHLFRNHNRILLRHILRHSGGCTRMAVKTMPYLVEYLLKVQHL
ncbi:MAG: FAD-dependent oxidoreductase [Thermoplasmatota archaeon]